MEHRVNRIVGVAAAALDYDAELMLRVKDGDGASFGLLLEKHRSAVIHFLYRMVQNHAVSEELAQEVFLRVYRSRSTYEPTAKFTTWLFRIATHLALNWLRDGKNERGQEHLDDTSDDMPARQVSDRSPSVEQTMVYAGDDQIIALSSSPCFTNPSNKPFCQGPGPTGRSLRSLRSFVAALILGLRPEAGLNRNDFIPHQRVH